MGEGQPYDNDGFESGFGLVPLSSGSPTFCVPLKRQVEERDNSAIKIVFMVSQTLSHAFSHVIFTVIL